MVLGSSRLIARVATIHLGHPGVHEDHLGAQAAAKFKGLHAILPFSHHLKVRVLLEQPSQRAPIQGMVIGDYYATAKVSMFHARRQDAPHPRLPLPFCVCTTTRPPRLISQWLCAPASRRVCLYPRPPRGGAPSSPLP